MQAAWQQRSVEKRSDGRRFPYSAPVTAAPSERSHWPGLDGFRGIAALAVLAFHVHLGPAVNGYVGVDVFFALSGFLITSILLREIDRTGRLRFARFYIRRALRLLPALAAVSLAVFVVGVAAGRAAEFGRGALAAMVYLANWWMYTGRPAPLLDHTWTLAIEEHFYVVWPVLLVGLCAGRRWIRVLTALVAVAIVAVVLTPWPEPITNVRSTYLRGFPIIWGSLLAAAARWPIAQERGHLLRWPATGALVVLLALLCIPWQLPERWLTGPTSGAGLLALLVLGGIVLAPSSPAAALLSGRLMRWAGTRSYGLYLYHFPILQILRHQVDVGPEWARMVLGIVVSIAMTEASFRWLESPFLRLKDRLGPSATARPAPLGSAG
ncbi:acyltransferase family protein [Janibacter sp. G368]|uniref:acyltransferase family protein n=1 Tax=Janibacter sp. G368 TaxID=3420441 RepID=UPI003D04D8AE